MVVWAKEVWIPILKVIWKECFGDEDWYIDFYFTNRFQENNMLVWVEAGEPVAMASLHSCILWEDNNPKGKKTRVRYIYGVATKPEFQGSGISTKLMEYIWELLKEKGEMGILVPAEEYLKDFYGKRGFFPGVITEEKSFPCNTNQQGDLQVASLNNTLYKSDFLPIKAEDYQKIRNMHFGRKGYVEWEEPEISYAMKENQKIGGAAYMLILEGEKHFIMVLLKKEKRELIVRESTLSDDLWERYGENIGRIFDCNLVVRKGLYTMSTDKNWKSGYFNLALD